MLLPSCLHLCPCPQIDTEVKAVRRQVEELRPKAEALEELRKELALMQQQVGRVGCWPWRSCARDSLLCSSRWGGQRHARGIICEGGAGVSTWSCSSGWGGRSCVQQLVWGVGCRGAEQATRFHATAGEAGIRMCNDAGGVLSREEVQAAAHAQAPRCPPAAPADTRRQLQPQRCRLRPRARPATLAPASS